MDTTDTSKPGGNWDVRRKIRIPALVHEADAMAVEAKVGSLPGVHAVTADITKRRVVVSYDVTVADYRSIIAALEEVGFPPLNDWLFRAKRSWYRFTEDNARENAKAPPSACCNKPPK